MMYSSQSGMGMKYLRMSTSVQVSVVLPCLSSHGGSNTRVLSSLMNVPGTWAAQKAGYKVLVQTFCWNYAFGSENGWTHTTNGKVNMKIQGGMGEKAKNGYLPSKREVLRFSPVDIKTLFTSQALTPKIRRSARNAPTRFTSKLARLHAWSATQESAPFRTQSETSMAPISSEEYINSPFVRLQYRIHEWASFGAVTNTVINADTVINA